MAGKDYLIYLSADGSSSGADTLVEDQGDLTINTGKTLSKTSYKDSSKSAQGNDGWSASFSTGLREPLGTGQALLFDAMDNGGNQHITIKSATTGGIEWEGPVKINVTQISLPVSGEPGLSVEVHEDGVVARGVTS